MKKVKVTLSQAELEVIVGKYMEDCIHRAKRLLPLPSFPLRCKADLRRVIDLLVRLNIDAILRYKDTEQERKVQEQRSRDKQEVTERVLTHLEKLDIVLDKRFKQFETKMSKLLAPPKEESNA